MVRPIFIPDYEAYFVKSVPVRFNWTQGKGVEVTRQNIRAVHEAAEAQGLKNIWEITTASECPYMRGLSAFNLKVDGIPVECAYQGSKVFENGGPHHELYECKDARQAYFYNKKKGLGKITGFNYRGHEIPAWPKTLCFDFLYIRALIQNDSVLWTAEGFTDIFFNPQTQIVCQARSAALWMAVSATHTLFEHSSAGDLYNLLALHEGEIHPMWDDNPLYKIPLAGR